MIFAAELVSSAPKRMIFAAYMIVGVHSGLFGPTVGAKTMPLHGVLGRYQPLTTGIQAKSLEFALRQRKSVNLVRAENYTHSRNAPIQLKIGL